MNRSQTSKTGHAKELVLLGVERLGDHKAVTLAGEAVVSDMRVRPLQ